MRSLVFALPFLAACSGSARDPELPASLGTRRALVLVEAETTAKDASRPGEGLSSKQIVERVMAP
jgi:hypothetical protein